MYSILMVEDHIDVFELINICLKSIAKITWAATVADARALCARETFDLILLDVQLPDGNGFSLCEEILSNDRFTNVPVLFISGNTSMEDKLKGFAVGGDDFILKPFNLSEVKARVETRLKKVIKLSTQKSTVRAGNLEINLSSGTASLVQSGKKNELEIGQTEFRLLKLLTDRQEQVLSRESIFESIWKGSCTDQRAVDTHVSKLRKKLLNSGVMIESVWGKGYRLTVTTHAYQAAA
jgi:DNA-binding response OmpR family regulator